MEIESEMKVSKFKRICVFCGSSQGKKTSYQDAAIELGKELVKPFFSNFFIIFKIFLLLLKMGLFQKVIFCFITCFFLNGFVYKQV